MPELRKDPIIGRWVIISTERGKRPHDFVVEPEVTKGGFCPFDEGNEHTTPPEVLAYRDPGTEPNTPGWQLRVVNNKFPALATEGELDRAGEGMFDKMNGVGSHEVIIESPDHRLTLATIPVEGFYRVLQAYRDRIMALSEDPAVPLRPDLQEPGPGRRRLPGAQPLPAHRPAHRAGAGPGGIERRQVLL